MAQERARLRGGRVGFGEAIGVLVVDMARVMVDERWSSPATTTVGREVVRYIAALLPVARQAGCPVLYSRDGLNYFLRGPRLTPAEQGAWAYKLPCPIADDERFPEEAFEIADAIAPAPGDVVFKKTKPSAFFASPLPTYLAFYRLDTLIVCGMMTSGCVRPTITDAFSYNYRVVVPRECAGDQDPAAHEANLRDIDGKLADVLPLADVLAELRSRAGVAAAAR